MADNIDFTLDGKTVTAEPGETIWQVADRLGTEIPHLCYAPEPGYRPDGNCRACMVEIEGERVLAASCIRKPSADMVVNSANARVSVGTTHKSGIKHPRKGEIIRELPSTREQSKIFLALDPFPNPFLPGKIQLVPLHLDRPISQPRKSGELV